MIMTNIENTKSNNRLTDLAKVNSHGFTNVITDLNHLQGANSLKTYEASLQPLVPGLQLMKSLRNVLSFDV